MPHLLLVDDDDLFRESLGLNLIDEGYEITSFCNGWEALSYLESGGTADVALLDWRMPNLTGLEVLRRMRRTGIAIPVIFLTVLSDDFYEEAALAGGAVDFIDKSRRLPILLKRLQLIAEGVRPALDSEPLRAISMRFGRLELRFDVNRALWAGQTVDLTLTEFKIVTRLAEKTEQDVGYREIYDLVHGKDFIAGHGAEGYRANVRTFIKRIRKKFRDVDPDFDHIENYPGFGYRWTARE
ncbi:MAG TPA: response regulator transcription factor [Stellaceae bacterium]|jgi:two-component system response regulator ChvI|nr:response regulator transcription factor [Stellaceae bacterium]